MYRTYRTGLVLIASLTLAACEGTPFHDDLTSQSYIAGRMNFGEASDHNLRMMVARKRDLYAPRRESPADAARRDSVISAYRHRAQTSQHSH
jgi:type IV pilus biogenesis protein CpaD/CtpE